MTQLTENLNFLDIKMMSATSDLPSLLHQRSVLEQKLSLLTPGQFQLFNRYNAQLSLLNSQITKHQQPSVVNIQNYTPKDSEFTTLQPKGNKTLRPVSNYKGLIQIREDEEQEEDSLDKTIQHLEESIREKRSIDDRVVEKLENGKRRIELP